MQILVGLLLIPFIEIFTFIKVGALIGAMPAILITILSTIIGLYLVKTQASSEHMKAISKMNAGVAPVQETMAGLYLLLAGVMLLIPGLVTDFFGAMLLIPWIRNSLTRSFFKKMSNVNVNSSYPSRYSFTHVSIKGKKVHSSKKDDVVDGVILKEHNDN